MLSVKPHPDGICEKVVDISHGFRISQRREEIARTRAFAQSCCCSSRQKTHHNLQQILQNVLTAALFCESNRRLALFLLSLRSLFRSFEPGGLCKYISAIAKCARHTASSSFVSIVCKKIQLWSSKRLTHEKQRGLLLVLEGRVSKT